MPSSLLPKCARWKPTLATTLYFQDWTKYKLVIFPGLNIQPDEPHHAFWVLCKKLFRLEFAKIYPLLMFVLLFTENSRAFHSTLMFSSCLAKTSVDWVNNMDWSFIQIYLLNGGKIIDLKDFAYLPEMSIFSSSFSDIFQ